MPLCYSLAFRDRFSAESRLTMVGIRHAATVRKIPTISPAAFRRTAASRLPAGPPTGKSVQIETFVVTRDVRLFR